MKKLSFFFIFISLFSLAFTFGCLDNGLSFDGSSSFGKGQINGTVLLNGKAGTTLNLVSEQNSQIGFKIKNVGQKEMTNVTGRLIGCLPSENEEGEEIIATEEVIPPNGQSFLVWDVEALKLSQSEELTCFDIIRICYNYESTGLTELKFVPEDYSGEPEVANTADGSDMLDYEFQFGTTRVLEDGNEVNGAIYLRNNGAGWIDYTNYNNNKKINHLTKLNLAISGEGVGFSQIGDKEIEPIEKNLTFSLDTESDNYVGKDYEYLLKFVQGKEDYIRTEMKVNEPDLFQDSPETRTLTVTAEHGYCVDVATVAINMRG